VYWAAAPAVPLTKQADGPILLFGGTYGNLEATQGLLNEARRLGIPNDHLICTGDVVAYCADAQETVALLRHNDIAVVMGNCEEQLGAGALDCGCGFDEGTACDLLSQQWYAYASAQLDEDAKAWMRTLPRSIKLNIAGLELMVVHGCVSEIARFVFASTPAAVLQSEINLAACDGVIGGHCGLPFTRIIDNKLWHNPGVIGMPANDGTPRVWYSILTPGDDGLEIQHHALSYDPMVSAQKIRQQDLPAGYADCLENGHWPSLDVLPDAEREVAGQALELTKPIIFRAK
jgi:predicted phosphodiesterase